MPTGDVPVEQSQIHGVCPPPPLAPHRVEMLAWASLSAWQRSSSPFPCPCPQQPLWKATLPWKPSKVEGGLGPCMLALACAPRDSLCPRASPSLQFSIPPLAPSPGKNYGKPRMSYSDYVTTPSGLQYLDVRVGTGPTPKPGQRVTIDWAGVTIGYYGRPFEARNKVLGGEASAWHLGGESLWGLKPCHVPYSGPCVIMRLSRPRLAALTLASSGHTMPLHRPRAAPSRGTTRSFTTSTWAPAPSFRRWRRGWRAWRWAASADSSYQKSWATPMGT